MPKPPFMRKICLFFSGLLLSTLVFAGGNDDSTKIITDILKRMDSIESSLHYKTGKLSLAGGIVAIDVPDNFKFLESEDAGM